MADLVPVGGAVDARRPGRNRLLVVGPGESRECLGRLLKPIEDQYAKLAEFEKI